MRLIAENGSIWSLMVGQVILTLSCPILLNGISLLANTWFGDKERSKATTMPGLFMMVGLIVCLLITGIVAADLPAIPA